MTLFRQDPPPSWSSLITIKTYYYKVKSVLIDIYSVFETELITKRIPVVKNVTLGQIVEHFVLDLGE